MFGTERVVKAVLALLALTSGLAVATPDSMGVVVGTVADALSGELLRGDVVVENSVFGSGMDSAGRFSILLLPGKYQLTANAWSYASASESATVSAPCTTRMDFHLFLQKYVNDSIMASLAKVAIRELARHPMQYDTNNSIRVAAWKTYLSGKGTCGVRSTGIGVEGQHLFHYLVIENGSVWIVHDSREATGRVSKRRFSYVQLVDRNWDPNSSRYVAVPFTGTVPKNGELRFMLSNEPDERDPVLF